MNDNAKEYFDSSIESTIKTNNSNLKKEITRSRKVGTLTLGASLICFGTLFLINAFTTFLTYEFVLKLWPIIFIILGFEVLISYIINKEDKLNYDKGAVFLLILLSLFAMGMAFAEFLVNYAQHYIY